jgi:hypothetical protein
LPATIWIQKTALLRATIFTKEYKTFSERARGGGSLSVYIEEQNVPILLIIKEPCRVPAPQLTRGAKNDTEFACVNIF